MKAFIMLLLSSTLFAGAVSAQEAGDKRLKEIADAAAKEKDKTGWTFGGGLGFDLAGTGILTPRVGSGAGRLGIGGLANVFANDKQDKWFWVNSGSLQLSTQRLGKTNPSQPTGFQKNLDVFQLASRYGYKLKSDKWFVALDGSLRTQFLKTYASNYLKPVNAEDVVVSKFLAPLQLSLSPGIEYKPDAHVSLFYSPCGVQLIYISDNDIANRNTFGNEPGKNYRLSLGSEFKAGYVNKYFKDKMAISSHLMLFSDYLNNPQNIKVGFNTTISIEIFKGLSLDLVGEYLYDHNILVIKDVNGDNIYNVQFNPDGTVDPTRSDDRLGHGGQITGGFFLKYSRIF